MPPRRLGGRWLVAGRPDGAGCSPYAVRLVALVGVDLLLAGRDPRAASPRERTPVGAAGDDGATGAHGAKHRTAGGPGGGSATPGGPRPDWRLGCSSRRHPTRARRAGWNRSSRRPAGGNAARGGHRALVRAARLGRTAATDRGGRLGAGAASVHLTAAAAEKLARLRMIEGAVPMMQRGQGSEFDSLREYVIGDDVRSIDWRASARSSDVVVRTWRPERDRQIVLALDTGRTSAARIGDEPAVGRGHRRRAARSRGRGQGR